MRFMKTMLLVSALVMSASAANAANMTFGVGGGVSMPMGDFADFAKLGFNGGVYGDYWIKDNYAFGVDITGNFFSGKQDLVDALTSTAFPDPSVKATLIGFGVHGLWNVPMQDSPVSPWITYGAGLYNISTKVEDAGVLANFDNSESKFGFNGGAGLNFKGSASMTPGINVKYHYVMTDNKATNYLTAGVQVTFKTSGN